MTQTTDLLRHLIADLENLEKRLDSRAKRSTAKMAAMERHLTERLSIIEQLVHHLGKQADGMDLLIDSLNRRIPLPLVVKKDEP